MYKLINNEVDKRTYKSEITGTEVRTIMLKEDENGKKWWIFEDLLNIPFIRKKAAEKIHQFYGAGFTKADRNSFVSKMKEILKSDDQEKYEKAYSELLQFDELAEAAGDAIKQSLSLCPVYILSDDEPIDTLTNAKSAEKMEYWSNVPELQAFFLSVLTDGMNSYLTAYNDISRIALSQN